MAIPEDAAITAYVVSLFIIPFVFLASRNTALMLGMSPGIPKNYVSLHGSPLFGHCLPIWTPNGL